MFTIAQMPNVILFVLFAVVAAVCIAAALDADRPIIPLLLTGGEVFFFVPSADINV